MRFLIILTIWTAITGIKVSAQERDSLDSLLDGSSRSPARRVGFGSITKAGGAFSAIGSRGRLERKGFSPVLSRGRRRPPRRRHLVAWGSSVVSSSSPKEVLSPSAVTVLGTSPRRSLPEPPAITEEKETTVMPSGPISALPPMPASPFPSSRSKYGRRSAKPPSLPGMAPSQPTERDKSKEVVPAATAERLALSSEETVIRPSSFSVIEGTTSSEEDLPPWLQD